VQASPSLIHLLGFFVANDNLHVDNGNPWMLKCIICKFEQVSDNVLTESYSIIRKGFIKYKCNGVTPMKTHIDCVHPKLLARRKQLIEMIPLDHIQQLA